jgi:ABC-type multidrug transport system fused ATPase/permease subunit
MQVEIKHVDILSITKICFVLYAILGLIIGVIYVFIALVLGSFLDYASAQGDLGLFRVAATGFGFLLVPLLALFYGCVGAIGGLFFGLFYNVISKAIGGIRVVASGDDACLSDTSIK